MSDGNQRISRRFVKGSAAISLISTLGVGIIGCSKEPDKHIIISQPPPGGGGGGGGGTTPPPAPVAGTATLELLINQHDLRVPVSGSVVAPIKAAGSVAPAATAPGSPLASTPATGGRVVLVPAGTVVTQMSSVAGVASGSVSADGKITLSNVPTTDQGTSLDAFIDLDGNDVPDGAINVQLSNNQVVAQSPIVRQRPQSSGLDLGVSLASNTYAAGDLIDFAYRGNNGTAAVISANVDLINPSTGDVLDTRAVNLPVGAFDLTEQFSTISLADGEYAIALRPSVTQQGMILSQNGQLEVEVKKNSTLPAMISLVQPNVHEVVDGSIAESLNDQIAISDQYRSGSPLNLLVSITDGATTREHYVFSSGFTGNDVTGTAVQNAQYADVTQTGTDEWYIRLSTQDGANTDFAALATSGDLEFIVRRKGGSAATQDNEEYAANFTLTAAPASPSDVHAPQLRITRQKNRGDAEVIRIGPNQFASYRQSKGLNELICESDKYRIFLRAEDVRPGNGSFTSSGLKEVRFEYSTDNGATWLPISTILPTNGVIQEFVEFTFPASGAYRVRFTAEDNAGNTRSQQRRVNACMNPANGLAVIRQELIDYDDNNYGSAAFLGGVLFDNNAGTLENQGGRGYARVNITPTTGFYDPLNDLVIVYGPHDAGSRILKRDPPDLGDRLNEGEDRIVIDDREDGTALPSRLIFRPKPGTEAELRQQVRDFYEAMRAEGRW